jgi:uncharacterized protein
MTLYQEILQDKDYALKKRDSVKKNLLTTIISDIRVIEKAKGKVSNSEIVAILKKYEKGIKENLAVKSDPQYDKELIIIEYYLPAQLDEDELQAIIATLVASDNANIGTIMKYLKTNYEGQYNGQMASKLIKGML